MNIFCLDETPITAAQNHCDRHVLKMTVESLQLLSTAHRVLDNLPPEDNRFYKATHQNHPSAKWVRESDQNYFWLLRLFTWLCSEYTHRYGKVHLCETKRNPFLEPPKNIKSGRLTNFALAMPEEYKNSDPVQAYRDYYISDKTYMVTWTGRECPQWFREGLNKKSGIDISESINQRGQIVQRPQLT